MNPPSVKAVLERVNIFTSSVATVASTEGAVGDMPAGSAREAGVVAMACEQPTRKSNTQIVKTHVLPLFLRISSLSIQNRQIVSARQAFACGKFERFNR